MYTNSNFSDDIRNVVDPNNSILKLTKQVRENIKSAKDNFDNFLRRTDNKCKIQNFDKTFEKDDITTMEIEDSSEKKPILSQKISKNVTSIGDEMSIRTPSCTKDVNVTWDVEPSPMYDHVQNNSTENTILKTSQEHENDPELNNKESNKESLNNTIIAQNEEDYK